MSESSIALNNQAAASANIFIDPAAAVKNMVGRWPWLLPVLILMIGTVVIVMVNSPASMEIMQNHPPDNIPPEQLERTLAMMKTFQTVGLVIAPIFVLLKLVTLAALMMGMSAILDVKTRFSSMFTLLSYASLITFLQGIAAAIVIKAKAGQLQSMQELQPPFGLDLLITESSKAVWAVMNYFSIFTLWHIVILVLAYSYMTGASRGKAALAITPAWLLPLLFSVVAAMMQR